MKLKHAILEQLDRDTLKTIVEDLELDGVDHRSREDMATALSRARRATAEVLLDYLYEDQVKQVCELVGVNPTGRRGKLVMRLLRSERNRRVTKRKGDDATMDDAAIPQETTDDPQTNSPRSRRSPRLQEETAEGAEGRGEKNSSALSAPSAVKTDWVA